MQMTENRLISVLSKTSYNTYNSILSLQKMLLRISKQVSEIIILGDSITIKETNFNKKHKLLLEEKIGLEIQVMEIPSLNDLASGEKMLQFDLQKGDIIDLRPGSSIHLALLLQQSQMATRIGQSPITLCVPSARGNRIHLAKIGNKGVENSITQSIVGSGDLNAFVQSILREDEYIEKKIITGKTVSTKFLGRIDEFREYESGNPDECKKLMQEMLDENEKSEADSKAQNNTTKWGHYYEAIAEKILTNLLKNINVEIAETEPIECWMNIRFKKKPIRSKNDFREEDVMLRIGQSIVLISLKFNTKTEKNWNSISVRLNKESQRISDLFSGIVPEENMHRYLVTNTPRGEMSGHIRVTEINLSQLEKELARIIDESISGRVE